MWNKCTTALIKKEKSQFSVFLLSFEKGKGPADAARLKPVFRGMMDVETNQQGTGSQALNENLVKIPRWNVNSLASTVFRIWSQQQFFVKSQGLELSIL